jgi:argininosuccinate lyase
MCSLTKSAVRVARRALAAGQACLRRYRHRFSPQKHTQAQLVACLVLKVFLKTDHRGVAILLEEGPTCGPRWPWAAPPTGPPCPRPAAASAPRITSLTGSRRPMMSNKRLGRSVGRAEETTVSQKTWGGRFSGATDNRVEAFTESISFDRRLYRQDVAASKAHARMLAEVGLLTRDEAERIAATLDQIAAEIESGRFPFSVQLEDIHTHIERALIERLGDVGRKLHTGRSRNDQVVTDVRLWVRDAIDETDGRLRELQRALLAAAERDHDLVLPGYTHTQRAQPVLAPHYFLAYVEKYQRDRDRLADCRRRGNVLPLGGAALAGTSLPIDRESVRRQLGFDSLAANSLDATSDRDFVLEHVFGLSLIALHLSGWAEEWILWSTTEFGFLELPDAFCTGSSIMPHKKNPDVLELIRAKAGRVAGDLQRLLMLVKGLPLAYNRDLQEDKVALFDAHDTVSASLEVAAALIRATQFNRASIAARLEDGYLDATTLMELFVARGVPMRAAHEAVGGLVRLCEQRRCRLADLTPDVYEAVRPGLGAEAYSVLGVENALAAFRSAGSTAPVEVTRQLAAWRQRLAP